MEHTVRRTKNHRPRSRASRSIALAAAGCMALSACADQPSDTTVAGGDTSTAANTLSVSDSGAFAGLVTGSTIATPTVDGETVTIDVGGGQNVTVDKDKKLNVGFFVQGTTSPFFQTAYAWAQAQATADGYTVEMVDAATDSATQADQLQSAISTKKYDAIIVIPVDGLGSCDALTKQAAQAGILVVDYFNPVCGKDDSPVENWHVPGLLGVVGGSTSTVSNQAFIEKILTTLPQGKGMTLNISESICVCGIIFNTALEAAQQNYPDVDLVRATASSPDAAGGQAVTEQYLKDNPDANFIIALSDETGLGAIEAINAAGLSGKVKVYVAGGTQAIVDNMSSGAIDGTYPYYMGSAIQAAMLMLHEAVAGNPVPTVIANDGHPLEPYSDTEPPFFTYVTPETAASGDYVANTVENASAR